MNSPSQQCYVDVTNNITAGSYAIQIQSQCGVGTTPYNETACIPGSTFRNSVPLLANGNYWLAVSSIDPGLKLGFSINCQ
jgi:hypothetical protein